MLVIIVSLVWVAIILIKVGYKEKGMVGDKNKSKDDEGKDDEGKDKGDESDDSDRDDDDNSQAFIISVSIINLFHESFL